jgi:hypothetical protein
VEDARYGCKNNLFKKKMTNNFLLKIIIMFFFQKQKQNKMCEHNTTLFDFKQTSKVWF